MIFQEDTTTIVLNFVVNPLIILVFLILGIRKMRKGKVNPLNFYLGTFFLFVVAGLIINIIYATLASNLTETAYTFLNRLSVVVIYYGVTFILYFTIALQKGVASITKAARGVYFVVMGVIIVLVLFIGQSTITGLRIVTWDPFLGWYAIIVMSLMFAFIIYYSFRILNVISNRTLKLKFGSFIIGFTVLFAGLLATVLGHMNLFSSTVSALILLVGIIPSGYLIYYGIDKGQRTT